MYFLGGCCSGTSVVLWPLNRHKKRLENVLKIAKIMAKSAKNSVKKQNRNKT
jgi:hypothetical protein